MNYPIIFIPGLFGSWGDDVIPGTGEFSFGFAEFAYGPFVNSLENMGYTKDKDLFICYYDWKLSVKDAVEKYLVPKINQVILKTNAEKIIIICHSLGGLLARYYSIEINSNTIDKTIMLGTPNQGSVEAYFFWSGGELPYNQVEDNVFYKAMKIFFILYYEIALGINYLDELRKIFPVARDLLPSNYYGNYLFTEENKLRKEIDIRTMDAQNNFLNELEKKEMIKSRLFIISGKNNSTDKYFLVKKNKHDKEKWKDGKPILKYKTNMGDGTVTKDSTLANLTYNNFVVDANHMGLLLKSNEYISEILGKTNVKEKVIVKDDTIHLVYGEYNYESKLSIRLSEGKKLSIMSENEFKNIDRKFIGKAKIITLDKNGMKFNDKELIDKLLKYRI